MKVTVIPIEIGTLRTILNILENRQGIGDQKNQHHPDHSKISSNILESSGNLVMICCYSYFSKKKPPVTTGGIQWRNV